MTQENANTQNGSPIGRAKVAFDETVGKTREAVGEQFDHAKERLQGVAGKVNDRLSEIPMNERLNDVQEKARQQTARAKEVAQEQYAVRSEQLKDGYAKARENMDHVSDDLGSFVRQNPGRAVLIAAGAGFLIGLLLRGRRD